MPAANFSSSRRIPTYGLYGETDGSNYFGLHCETIASRSRLHNWEISPHRHKILFQMLYVEAGSGDAELEDRVLRIEPPMLILIPPRCVHGFRFSEDVSGLVLTLPASRVRALSDFSGNLSTMLTSIKMMPIDRANDDQRYLSDTIRYLGREYAAGEECDEKLIDTSLRLVIRLAARLSVSTRSRHDGFHIAERGKYLVHLIARDCRINRSVAHYAQAMRLSPAQLNRISVKSTGRSVRELILYELTRQAKQELIVNTARIQEVSFALGFSDPAYFSKFFLHRVGVTPRAYRMMEGSKADVHNDSWDHEFLR